MVTPCRTAEEPLVVVTRGRDAPEELPGMLTRRRDATQEPPAC